LLEEILSKVLSEALNVATVIVSCESERLKVPKPNLKYTEDIMVKTEGKIYGAYDEKTATIYISVKSIKNLLEKWLKRAPKTEFWLNFYRKQTVKLTVEMFLHEFKHHVDYVKKTLTPEAYAKNPKKYDIIADAYAKRTLKRYQHQIENLKYF
jgi:hypothetical protein